MVIEIPKGSDFLRHSRRNAKAANAHDRGENRRVRYAESESRAQLFPNQEILKTNWKPAGQLETLSDFLPFWPLLVSVCLQEQAILVHERSPDVVSALND